MKRLILMRHGKSSWKNADIDDFDRPLKKRGKRDARFMAEFLVSKKLLPDLILASSALRTHQTTELVNEVFKLNDSYIRYYDDFYLSDQEEFIDTLIQLSNTLQSVMNIGHNPTIEFFISSLTNESHRFPTAAVAHIELNISNWAKLETANSNGKLLNIWRPKELR